MPRTRSAVDRACSASSARITPRLPDSPSGLTTHGRPTSRATAATSAPEGSRAKRGCGTPASASARRIAALSRVRATAAGGLCGSPRRSAPSAAAITPWSSTPTTAANGVSRARSAICSAATCRVRQPQGERTFAHRRRHRRPALGRHRDRDAELPRRRQEVRRPVGGRRQDQEKTVHGAIVDRWPTQPPHSSRSRHRPSSACATSAPPRPTRAIACCPCGSPARPTANTSARCRSSRRPRSAPATPCSTRGISPSWWPTTASRSCAGPRSTGARTRCTAASWSSTRTSRLPRRSPFRPSR